MFKLGGFSLSHAWEVLPALHVLCVRPAEKGSGNALEGGRGQGWGLLGGLGLGSPACAPRPPGGAGAAAGCGRAPPALKEEWAGHVGPGRLREFQS